MNKPTTGKTPISPPQIPNAAELLLLDTLVLESDADFGNFNLNQGTVSGANGSTSDSVVECAQFTRSAFTSIALDKCRLDDIAMEGCDLSNTSWLECKLSRVQFIDCKLTGFKLIDAQVNNALLERCVGQLIQLCGSTFKKIIFRECNLSGADFSGCNFEDTSFVKCNLRDAIFYGATLGGANLSSSELFGMKVYPQDLKGTTIDRQQLIDIAPTFAEILEVVVKDA